MADALACKEASQWLLHKVIDNYRARIGFQVGGGESSSQIFLSHGSLAIVPGDCLSLLACSNVVSVLFVKRLANPGANALVLS